MEEQEKHLVQFKCKLCGEPFEAPQGSRQELCDKCLVKQVRGKKTKAKA